jgi:hypothetical protein
MSLEVHGEYHQMDDEHRTDVAVEHQRELVGGNQGHAFQSMTLLSLLKTLTKPKTLPHIGLLVTSSIVLFTFFSGSKEYQAMLFISLSLAYVLLGFIFGSKFENLMLPKDADAGIKVLKRIFLPLIPPIVLSIVLFILMVSIFDVENGPGQFIPTFLASLFVVWSILQGRALLHWLRASGHQLPLLPTNTFILIPMFILILYVVMFGYDVMILGNTSISWSEYLLMFALIIITTPLLLYLTRHQKNRSQEQEFQARYTRMLFLSILFVTWHFFTIQRQLREAGSSALMYFEEIILMIFTVIMSIWALTSRSYKSSLQLVNEENALPVGIAFGFAYAGSIAVLSDLFGDVRNVLIVGHAIVILTVVLGLGKIIDKIHHSMIQESEVHALVESLPAPINEIIVQPVEEEYSEPELEVEEIEVAIGGQEDDDVELL